MELREIAGYPGYFVTADGRVFSGRRGELRELIPWADANGYQRVKISPERSRRGKKRLRVHRLVLMAFGEIALFPGLEVRHLNGDRKDNRIENLAWGTHWQNMQDAIRHGTLHMVQPPCQAWLKLKPDQVREIRGLYHSGLGPRVVGRCYGVSASTVKAIWTGGRYGHVF